VSRATGQCPYGGAALARPSLPNQHRSMFSGAHVILYSQDADADRAFLKDVLGFLHVEAGDGRLIFKLPPAESPSTRRAASRRASSV
jgi:hypothetical protein